MGRSTLLPLPVQVISSCTCSDLFLRCCSILRSKGEDDVSDGLRAVGGQVEGGGKHVWRSHVDGFDIQGGFAEQQEDVCGVPARGFKVMMFLMLFFFLVVMFFFFLVVMFFFFLVVMFFFLVVMIFVMVCFPLLGHSMCLQAQLQKKKKKKKKKKKERYSGVHAGYSLRVCVDKWRMHTQTQTQTQTQRQTQTQTQTTRGADLLHEGEQVTGNQDCLVHVWAVVCTDMQDGSGLIMHEAVLVFMLIMLMFCAVGNGGQQQHKHAACNLGHSHCCVVRAVVRLRKEGASNRSYLGEKGGNKKHNSTREQQMNEPTTRASPASKQPHQKNTTITIPPPLLSLSARRGRTQPPEQNTHTHTQNKNVRN